MTVTLRKPRNKNCLNPSGHDSEVVLLDGLLGIRSVGLFRAHSRCSQHAIIALDVFHQVFNMAIKVLTKLVNGLSASAVAALIEDFGQSHPIEIRRISNFADRQTTSINELLLLNHFT